MTCSQSPSLRRLRRRLASWKPRVGLAAGVTTTVASLLSLSSAQAANKAYSTAPTDGTFSGINWNVATVPTAPPTTGVVSGDALFFGTSSILALTNDLTGAGFLGFTFNAGANAFTIGGNTFDLTGNFLNASTVVQTINAPFALSATRTFTTTTGGGNIALNGDISGAGGVTVAGAGALTLTGNNSYAGNTTVGTGTILNVNGATALGTGTLVFSGNGIFNNNSGTAVTLTNNNGLTLSGGSPAFTGTNDLSFGTGALTISGGNRTLTTTAGTLTVGSLNADTTARAFTKAGAGTLVVTGAAGTNFGGATNLNGGTLAVGDNAALGAGTLAFGGGTLASSVGARTFTNALTSANATSILGGTNDLTFSGAFTNLGSGTLNVTNTGTTTFNGPITLRDTLTGTRSLTFTGTGPLVLNSNINPGTSTNAVLALNGTSTTTLAGNNTYNGNTTIGTAALSGTVRLGSATALGFGSPSAVAGVTTVSTGSTLDLNGQTGIVEPIVVNGAGIGGNGVLINGNTTTASSVASGFAAVGFSNAGAGFTDGTFPLTITGGGGTGATGQAVVVGGVVVSVQVTNPGTGYTTAPTVTLTGAGTPTTAAAFTTAISGVTLNSAGSVGGAGNLTVNGPITGNNALTKVGAGALTVTAPNTYTGLTTVSAGSLLVNNAAGSGTGSGSVTVANAATLGGAGIIALGNANTVTIQGGGNLAPGNGPGILSITGSQTVAGATSTLNLAAGANFRLEIGGVTPGADYDRLTIGGTVNVTGSNLFVTLLNGFVPDGTTPFVIISNDLADAVTGTFAQGTTVTANTGQMFNINYAGGDGNDVVLTAVNPVPEPGTYAMLLGGVALLIGLQRRRSRTA